MAITITPTLWRGAEPVVVRGSEYVPGSLVTVSVAPTNGGAARTLGTVTTDADGT